MSRRNLELLLLCVAAPIVIREQAIGCLIVWSSQADRPSRSTRSACPSAYLRHFS